MKRLRYAAVLLVVSAFVLSLAAWYGLTDDRPQEMPSVSARKQVSRHREVIRVVQPLPGDTPEPMNLPPPSKAVKVAKKATVAKPPVTGLTPERREWLENRQVEIELKREDHHADIAHFETAIKEREATLGDQATTYVPWDKDLLTQEKIAAMEPETAKAYKQQMADYEEIMRLRAQWTGLQRRFLLFEIYDDRMLLLADLAEEEHENALELAGVPVE